MVGPYAARLDAEERRGEEVRSGAEAETEAVPDPRIRVVKFGMGARLAKCSLVFRRREAFARAIRILCVASRYPGDGGDQGHALH